MAAAVPGSGSPLFPNFGAEFQTNPFGGSPGGRFGSPLASTTLPEVSQAETDFYLRKLQEREAAKQPAAKQRPAKVSAGIKGAQGMNASQTAPTRPASPGVAKEFDATRAAELTQGISAKELELSVLRSRVEKYEREAQRLTSQIHNNEMRLFSATGDVSALSAKVEATAEARKLHMQATQDKVQDQIDLYKQRLAKMREILAEKDEDIRRLQLVIQESKMHLDVHRETLLTRRNGSAGETAQPVAAPPGSAASKKQLLDLWIQDREALIEQEKLDAQHARERRQVQGAHGRVEDEIAKVRWSMSALEDRIQNGKAALARAKQVAETMAMEEKLRETAGQLEGKDAEERKRNYVAEARMLEARIEEEKKRKADLIGRARDYDSTEDAVQAEQARLAALTACLREISRTLRSAGPGGRGDRVDGELERWLMDRQSRGEAVPPVMRIGPQQYQIFDKTVILAISDGGRLCVRMPEGGLYSLDDYLYKRVHRETPVGAGSPL